MMNTIGGIIDETIVTTSITEVLKVPAPLASMIVGRGAEHIKSLEHMYSVNINVEKENAMNAMNPFREVTIRGREEMVQKVKEVIQVMVQTGNPSIVRSMQTSRDGFEVVSIPRTQVGLVVGARGATVHDIQKRTGTTINIAKENDPKNPEMRNITITGPPENVKEAKRQVLSIASVSE